MSSFTVAPRPASAVQAVRRGLVTTALFWQPLWFLALPGLQPQAQPGPVATVLVLCVAVSWLVLLVTHVRGSLARWPAGATVATLALATAAVNNAQIRVGEVDPAIVAELGALAAGVAGLLLSWRWGLTWTVLMLVPLIRDLVSVVTFMPTDLIPLAYVTTMGLSAVAVRQALLRNAAAADSAAEELSRVSQQRRTADQVERTLQQTERRLHETVLNTLIALSRGGVARGADHEERIRERCAESARLLTTLSHRPTTSWVGEPVSGALDRDVRSQVADLESSGVDIQWQVDPLDRLPGPVYVAVRSAVAEALINVRRHAGARQVVVRGVLSGGRTTPTVAFEITDDGIGFDPRAIESRFGLTEAILAPMAEVGGTAEVISSPGSGTTVTLEWRRQPAAVVQAPISASALSVPLLATAGIYVATMAAVTWSDFTDPGVNGLALLMFAGGAAGVILQTRRARLTWPMVAAVAVLGWVVYALQGMAAEGADVPEWSSSGVAVLFMVAAATGPRWSWVFLVAMWLVIQGDPVHEVTQPGTAIILVGALLGRSTRRNARLAAERRRERSEGLDEREATQARLDRLTTRYAALAESDAPRLLASVGSGEIPPDSKDVQQWSVHEERFIRTVMLVDPQADEVHRLADALSRRAHARGVLLDVDLAAADHPMPVLPAEFQASCVWAIDHAALSIVVGGQPTGTCARLSSRDEGNRIVVRLLVPLTPECSPADAPSLGDIVDPDDPAGPVCLWETATAFGTENGGDRT